MHQVYPFVRLQGYLNQCHISISHHRPGQELLAMRLHCLESRLLIPHYRLPLEMATHAVAQMIVKHSTLLVQSWKRNAQYTPFWVHKNVPYHSRNVLGAHNALSALKVVTLAFSTSTTEHCSHMTYWTTTRPHFHPLKLHLCPGFKLLLVATLCEGQKYLS